MLCRHSFVLDCFLSKTSDALCKNGHQIVIVLLPETIALDISAYPLPKEMQSDRDWKTWKPRMNIGHRTRHSTAMKAATCLAIDSVSIAASVLDGFPAILAASLMRSRRHDSLHSSWTQETMSFLLSTSEEEYAYLDCLVLARSALVSAFAVFAYRLGGDFQAFSSPPSSSSRSPCTQTAGPSNAIWVIST